MSTKVKNRNIDFSKYLEDFKHQAKDKASKDYYHVDVVVDAYNKGLSDGKKLGEKDFINDFIRNEIDKFTRKANQIYILSKDVISHLKNDRYNVTSLHINLNKESVILSVPNDLLVNDEFAEKAYSKISENREIYSKLFQDYLDIGIVESDNLNKELLKEDGFEYFEEYQ